MLLIIIEVVDILNFYYKHNLRSYGQLLSFFLVKKNKIQFSATAQVNILISISLKFSFWTLLFLSHKRVISLSCVNKYNSARGD